MRLHRRSLYGEVQAVDIHEKEALVGTVFTLVIAKGQLFLNTYASIQKALTFLWKCQLKEASPFPRVLGIWVLDTIWLITTTHIHS